MEAVNAAVNVNGRMFDRDHAVVSVFDHGFLYGEGVYEVLRTYAGEPFLFGRHMRRLRRSAEMMTLDVPLSNDQIAVRIRETIAAAGLGEGREAYVRLMVTRGVGELSYDPAACTDPTVVIIVKPHVDPPREAYERGVKAALVSIVRNHPGTVTPVIKSNNLLNSALAMQEAVRAGAFEGIMRNYQGDLAECTTANLFIVKDGRALTPPLDAGLLPGITREFVFEVGRGVGIPVEEKRLRDEDLFAADEAFLTSTTREVLPITRVDDHSIGNGRPGPVTVELLAEFRKCARATLTQGEVARH
jgi:branched-chain amino acid aminotransferase